MMTHPTGILQVLAKRAPAIVAALVLAACAPAPAGRPIMTSAPTTGLVAVSAEGSTSVRILYARGGSIVLMRTVFLPPGERVHALAWSSDERDAVITTTAGVLALDTRTWRLAPVVRLAALARDDAGAGGRR
jgi:hypothetical protein